MTTPLDLIREHVTHARCHDDQLRADAILLACNIDVDEGTSVAYTDAVALALTCEALATAMLARTTDAHDVPAMTLAEAVDDDGPTLDDAREELRASMPGGFDETHVEDMQQVLRDRHARGEWP